MTDCIHCIDADIYRREDGSLDCVWLTPYFGDLSLQEYKEAGTALSVKRGCEYCYMMLEWKTRMKEEGWTNGVYLAHGEHPDWPGEWVCVNQVLNNSELVGYEVQWKLYKTLHEVEEAGWTLKYSYFNKGKEIYESERRCELMAGNCGIPKGYESQCCLNQSGWCTLDTADFLDIDRAVGMRGCGFIGVNDRYLLWKYGVSYKDFNCGHCAHYSGETHGECLNEAVPKHLKGVVVNGEKTYIDTRERYEGANACSNFKKQEGERVAKKKYWTKCGRNFEKNSTAEVTGYAIDENDKKCADCPFQVDVTKGWPPVHDHWECRAGSQKPNHKTTWRGSLEDKNTIQIDSLDNEFMERVLQFCKDQPDLGANYNADHLADCRRTIAISCSSNKKGIAAKKALIEKFFPAQVVAPIQNTTTKLCIDCTHCQPSGMGDGHPFQHKCINAYHRKGLEFYFSKDCETCDNFVPVELGGIDDDTADKLPTCESCSYSEDHGDSVMFILCAEGERRKRVQKKQAACANYLPVTDAIDDEPEGDLEDQLNDLLKEGDKCMDPLHAGVYHQNCKHFLKVEGFETTGRCQLDQKAVLAAGIICDHFEGKKKPRNIVGGVCEEMREDCPCFCKHNDGCAVLLIKGESLKSTIEDFNEKHNIDCDVYKSVVERVMPKKDILEAWEDGDIDELGRPMGEQAEDMDENENEIKNDTSENVTEKPEILNESTEIANVEPETVTAFDYSTVDTDTAAFLQEKSNNIIRYKLYHMLDVAKELKESQDKLANHNQGTFIAWCASIGYSKSTVYDHLRVLDWVVRHSDNGLDFGKMQTSLLQEVSKKSTPPGVEEKVLSGEITSRKELEAEKQRIRAEVEAEFQNKLEQEKQQRIAAQDRAEKIAADNRAAENDKFKLRQENTKAEKKLKQKDLELGNVLQQLEQAKRNSDPAKVEELGEKINGYQQEITSLKQQLREKPIEVPAVREVIPDEVKDLIFKKVLSAIEAIRFLTPKEIEIFVEGVTEDDSEFIRGSVFDAVQTLNGVDTALLEVCDD